MFERDFPEVTQARTYMLEVRKTHSYGRYICISRKLSTYFQRTYDEHIWRRLNGETSSNQMKTSWDCNFQPILRNWDKLLSGSILSNFESMIYANSYRALRISRVTLRKRATITVLIQFIFLRKCISVMQIVPLCDVCSSPIATLFSD